MRLMRLTFRPLPWFTLACVVMAVLLCGLGVWQLQRLQWKLGLIASTNQTLVSPPISLAAALRLGKDAEYHPVALTGHFRHDREVYVYAIAQGAPVYHVLTPFVLDNGQAMVIDRGIVPEELRDPAKRAAGQLQGEQRVVAIWRKPDPASGTTAVMDKARRIWFARDAQALARESGLQLAAPAILEADKTPNPGGWPKGGQTVVTLRNAHLEYAITWFCLAGLVLVAYAVVHISLGRLAWAPPHDPVN